MSYNALGKQSILSSMTITVQADGLSKAERRQLLAISTASLRDTMARLARVNAAAQRLALGSREAVLRRRGRFRSGAGLPLF